MFPGKSNSSFVHGLGQIPSAAQHGTMKITPGADPRDKSTSRCEFGVRQGGN